MCGIVGIFTKTEALRPTLGQHLSDMLITMSDRGPDSAGIAVYGSDTPGMTKITVQADDPARLAALDLPGAEIRTISTHAVISMPDGKAAETLAKLRATPGLRIMGSGARIEIFKEVGLPADVSRHFALPAMSGTHGIGHTRMATESAVTTDGAHPFSTGPDQCLVHNGSLSNHNSVRRRLARDGVTVSSENDSEVAAAYLTHAMSSGRNLGQALESALKDLDGFFTFVVGTRDGFGVLRDPIACKPAVMAETADYVAFGSEYRALAPLPGIEHARIWEPEPAKVYFWEAA
ncbi:glutamine amidotransferase [Oceanicola sp. 22II-s10i]|uniref:class II glutamine amidotransferase n=1 Tax=Oceanicola sp. 22II-s10i TaxID=1317116 RepID=UPI000B52159F|nr:glutamine amidotransferase family protein [Oceanicola sp. 22II-s10i]OWU83242.1 glutamine amidotransferase [Oceanicola sp. 22II-s10i]